MYTLYIHAWYYYIIHYISKIYLLFHDEIQGSDGSAVPEGPFLRNWCCSFERQRMKAEFVNTWDGHSSKFISSLEHPWTSSFCIFLFCLWCHSLGIGFDFYSRSRPMDLPIMAPWSFANEALNAKRLALQQLNLEAREQQFPRWEKTSITLKYMLVICIYIYIILIYSIYQVILDA